MTAIDQYDSAQVFFGANIGKGRLRAVALDRKDERLLDGALPNDEMKLRGLLSKPKHFGQILVAAERPVTAGAILVAALRTERMLVAYLPRLACTVSPICTLEKSDRLMLVAQLLHRTPSRRRVCHG